MKSHATMKIILESCGAEFEEERYKVQAVCEERCVNYNTENTNKKTSMLKPQENKCPMYPELKLC